jgi:radical SAM protein with 4Fe4S-binding SPASM domain
MCTIVDWERGSKPMEDQLFSKLAAELSDHSDEVKRISLHRDGEPLMDKKLAGRIAMLKDGGIKNVAISTNISLLNESRSRDILEAGLDTMILSMDSLKKEVFESIRVRLNFEEVLENTLRFIDLRNKIRPETQIWVRMVRQESNKDEWPEYYKFWSERVSENDRVYFRNIHNWGAQLKGFTPISTSFEPNLPCVALWSLMCIFCDGEVPLCNVDFNNKYPTGNVAANSIEEVWQSQIMKQRRQLHLSGNKGKIDPCLNCNAWDEPPDAQTVSSEFATEITLEAY